MGNLAQEILSRQPTVTPSSQQSILAPSSNPRLSAILMPIANSSARSLIVTGLGEAEVSVDIATQQVPADDASRQHSICEDALQRMLNPKVQTMFLAS